MPFDFGSTQHKAPRLVTGLCSKVFKNQEDIDICINSSMAGMKLSSLFNNLRKNPKKVSFSTPDRSKVFRTSHSHPDSQCRLDTYFQGALCEIGPYENMIFEDELTGACVRMFGFDIGVRPRCWYKPKSW